MIDASGLTLVLTFFKAVEGLQSLHTDCEVITACKQTLRYELLSEWIETSLVKSTTIPDKEFDTSGTEESDPQSPRSPSPPPPWTPEEHEDPVTTSTPNKRHESIHRTVDTDQRSKRKNTSTVAVAKKVAKVLSTSGPKQMQNVGLQVSSATCSIPSSLLQKSRELLRQKKDEATNKGTSKRDSVQTPSIPNQTMPTPGAARVTATTQTNAVEDAGNIKAELRLLHTMFETLRQDVKKVEAAVAKLTEEVSGLQKSHRRVSLSNTSEIFVESMDLLNEEPSYEESSFSTPALNDHSLSSLGITLNAPPLAWISGTTVDAPPHTSTTPSLAGVNTREPSGGCELSHTFLESLSCYADRPSAVARKLANVIFTRRETETCNCNGSHGREALSHEKLASLKKYLFEITQTPPSRQAAVWRSVTTCLDASFRSQRAYKKKKQLAWGVENNQ
ncbi:hypothetical protein HOLleu_21571 [Holothuria leucospilota]|uniref:BEN domain-containing protein n=1 Tax=Holothuria leucospilota TaxID=206669 RepID=A0A9Q1BXM8_HOLLE|nr:hypothetical protein HOLleu_21571 [Holothuria leucospilota]